MIVGGIPMLFGGGGGPITSLGTLGTGLSATAGTTLTLTTTAAAEIGNVVILLIGKDNVQTTDGNTSEVTGVTDTAGNVWVKLREYCNGRTAANAGVVISVWKSKITSTLALGGVITATMSSSITVKGMTAWEFQTIGDLAIAGTPQDLAVVAGSALGSLTISGLADGEYLFVRGIAIEDGNTTDLTSTASFTIFSMARANPAAGTSSVKIVGEFRILTGTTSTSNPTLGTDDSVSVFVALQSV